MSHPLIHGGSTPDPSINATASQNAGTWESIAPQLSAVISVPGICSVKGHAYEQGMESYNYLLFCSRCGDVIEFKPSEEVEA